MAFEILVPQLGIKPVPPVVEAQSLNPWTTREVHYSFEYYIFFFSLNLFILIGG